MKSVFALFIALAILCGCTRLSDRGFERAKFTSDAGQVTQMRLADYTAFDWDRVHVFAPYTPATVIAAEVGRPVPFPNGSSESHCLLVFMSGDDIVAAFEVERQPADFAGLFRKGGYSLEEAVFAVTVREADRWRYLEQKTANKAPEPTPLAVTSPAVAGAAPASVVAHL